MLYDTHVKIGLNTLSILSDKDKELIVQSSFLRGNILPDLHPSYRVRKHRLKQFEGKVNKKIKYLSSLNYNDIGNKISYKKFSLELGIICHFLSDFFCMPHSQWGVKESMTLKHMKYERHLHKHLLDFGSVKEFNIILCYDEYKDFLEKSLIKYKKVDHYTNDLYYSMYMCNSVVKFILNNIYENSK